MCLCVCECACVSVCVCEREREREKERESVSVCVFVLEVGEGAYLCESCEHACRDYSRFVECGCLCVRART